MAEARQKAEWQRFAGLMALLANINRDPKRKAFSPDDFNPYGGGSSGVGAITLGRKDALALFRTMAAGVGK